jgi:pimeloyl-ACP methyl ester carboxylesterase
MTDVSSGAVGSRRMGIYEGRISANEVDFAYLEAGSGPLALCLHGFPDTAHTWRHLLPALAGAGFRAVAPFQRGYAPTSIPEDGRYQSGVLAVDANALHDALDADGEAVIIGHDWGALGAYGAAVLDPARWRRVVGLAVPPGGALGQALVTNLAQLERSWYMFFFQHPLADLVVPAGDAAFLARLWKTWSPGYEPADDLVRVRESLGDPANLQAALGYYRATVGGHGLDPDLADAQAATSAVPKQHALYLHGLNDGCVGLDVAEAARPQLPSHVEMRVVEGTGHFLHLERPDVVNSAIVRFVA